MVLEEENHAAIIEYLKKAVSFTKQFPVEILPQKIEELRNVSKKLDLLITQYKEETPSREDAFNQALTFEKSAGELHYQLSLERTPDSEIVKIFQQLNQDDKDHYIRISKYMKTIKLKLLCDLSNLSRLCQVRTLQRFQYALEDSDG